MFKRGDFAIAESLPAPPLHQDEVGTLHRNFTIMIQRINELIKENYEKQLLIKETEFKALQAQINPHFLYNTLESINWLAKANQQKQISKNGRVTWVFTSELYQYEGRYHYD
ncbi:hypothetical protein GCM10020331_075900 [Ectobacillus funiculus]